MTKSDLMHRVAWTLRLVDEDEDPSDSQASRITDAIDDYRAELLESGRCWWDADDIPQAVVGVLKILVADQVKHAFGKAMDPVDVLRAERRLNKLASTEEHPTIPGMYY